MIKLKFYTIFFILIFSSFKSFAIPRCDQFYTSIYNDTINTDVFNDTNKNKKVIGIRLLKYWNENKVEEVLGGKYAGWDLQTNEDGYFIVGKVTKYNPEIKVGDVVLSINGKDLRELAKDKKLKRTLEKDVSDLFEADEKITFKLLKKVDGKFEEKIVDNKYGFNSKDISHLGEDLQVKESEMLFNSLEDYDEPYIDFYINSLNMNEKKGTFDANIETSFYEPLDDSYYLTKKVWDDLISDKKFNENNELESFYWEYCTFNEDKWKSLNTKDPAVGLRFDNVVREDKNTKTSTYTIKPTWPYYRLKGFEQDQASIEYNSIGNYTFGQKFNLRTYPFDKQEIKIFLYNYRHSLDDFKALVSDYTTKRAIEFKELNNIEGWNITRVDTNYEFYSDPNVKSKHDGVSVVFELERKSSYYVYKIILPIILILTVCWSAMWINTKELESRLTITIVCLLSLIAYNFVIDSDLPKLEYLTIMDYIILISYVFATIPNFLAIICYNLMKKNKQLVTQLEFYGKKFGLPFYILIIFLIIILNTSLNINNTNSMLTWMTN